MIGEVAVDRGLVVDKGPEDAPLQAAARELGKETFHRIEPGRRSRGEVEGPARMARQPGPDLEVRVAAIIVEHHMDPPTRRDVTLEAVEKTQELLAGGAACTGR